MGVMWVKVTLIFEELVKTLRDLYIEFLKKHVGLKDEDVESWVQKVEKEESIIKPSVIQEFSWDYEKFLSNWNNELMQSFSKDNIEKITNDLSVIKIEKLSEVLIILKIFYNLIKEFFPNFIVSDRSPIKISISVSSEKFPFFEH